MIKILTSQREIDESRKKLAELGVDTSRGLSRAFFKMMYYLRFRTAPGPVAVNKSWDVLSMMEIVEKNFNHKEISIYDMGSFNCEIPVVLWKRGYNHIRAADLNPLGRCIRWYGNNINFQCENFYNPPVPDNSFDVITCLSVMEHGFDQDFFLKSVLRMLKPGGIILITTDYHQEKIDIDPDFRIFNLTYTIFSKIEIESFMRRAYEFGLEPLGKSDWQNSEYPIEFLGHKMTFILLALRKRK